MGSQFDSGGRIIEFPEQFREKRIEMVYNFPFGYVQSVAVLVCFLPDRNVNIAILDVNLQGKDRTTRGLPLVFGMKRTESLVIEEITGLIVDIHELLAIFGFSSDEIVAFQLFEWPIERFTCGEFAEVLPVEQHSVMTTPGTLGHALERERIVELNDCLTAGVHLHARMSAHERYRGWQR